MEKQRTFGDQFGLDELVDVRPHPSDLVTCEDGTIVPITEAFEDCNGNYHVDEDDRDEANLAVVEEFLDNLDKWVTEYTTENTDFVGDYAHIVDEVSHDWNGPVEEWLDDNCRELDGCHKELADLICANLQGAFDCEEEYNHNEYARYHGDGCCLWSFDIGEHEQQVDVSCDERLQRLNDAGLLADLLDQANTDSYVGCTRDLSRRYPSFYTYHQPGGRWDFIVPAERMQELLTEAIIEFCQK